MTTTAAGAARWRSHAFGLALDSAFPLTGCAPSAAPNGLARVTLEYARPDGLRRALPRNAAVISWELDPTGARVPGFVAHPRAGYLIDRPRFGAFRITSGGRRVSCGPAATDAWRWQRFLIAQVLPFASALRGFEPWHAAAVALGDAAVSLSGGSGTGKSTLAAHLILAGARLLADDVTALLPRDGNVFAYPGPELMSLRRESVLRLGSEALQAIGTQVGADDRSLRLAVVREQRPLPLRAAYLLEPAVAGEEPRLTADPAPDPRRLLGSTFNLALAGRERVLTQLEVCATIARSVRVVRVRVPRAADLQGVAELVLADATAAAVAGAGSGGRG